MAFIEESLKASRAANQWTNFGPVSLALEDRIAEILELDRNKSAVACASATAGLHALIDHYQYLHRRPLRWVVCAYTFRCQNQGPLKDAIVVDSNEEGFLNFTALQELSPDDYDGVVYTQLFGMPREASEIAEFARSRDKLLVFDSATSFYSGSGSKPLGNLGDAQLFSFHHTKPWGFGEGGVVILDKDLEKGFRSSINSGLSYQVDTGALSGNAKMSDIAAAFILDRLRNIEALRDIHAQQYTRIVEIAAGYPLRPLIPVSRGQSIFPAHVPMLLESPVTRDELGNASFVCGKYYKPLKPTPNASEIYARVFSVPCHRDMQAVDAAEFTLFFEKLAGFCAAE
jgi:dTDP-4-amino-4,6-dideoxygalactose transaminase